MLTSNEMHRENSMRRLWVLLALLPFVSIPILGSLFYFRHDDCAILLWAKEFTKPFYYAFSSDPNVNEFFKYPGMGDRWRPFSYLYVKLLWHLFGANPVPYFISGGILFMAAVYFLFKIAENISGNVLAFLSCLFLFITFQNMMYNLFHVNVAVSFFYQLGMIYFFLSFLEKGKWAYFVGAVVFLVPAMVRETTPLILGAILMVSTLNHSARIKVFSIKYFMIIIVLVTGFYLMTFSTVTSSGTVLSVFPNIYKILGYVNERFLYYGAILTSGSVGIIIVPVFTFGLVNHLSGVVKEKYPFIFSNHWVQVVVTILIVLMLWLFKNISMYWLAFCILYLFLFADKLRLPLGWAGASLLSFLSAGYYHNGYLLEAGFPLSLALAIMVMDISVPYRPILLSIKQKIAGHKRILILGGLLVGCLVVVGIGGRGQYLHGKFEVIDVIRIAVDSNRNFKHLMDFLQREIPQNAVVYELSEEEIGTTLFDRRFFSLRERALRTKVMNIEDTLTTLKLLNRIDVRLSPSSELDLTVRGGERYFIVLNNHERRLAEDKFPLELIQEFKTNLDSAAVYRIKG